MKTSNILLALSLAGTCLTLSACDRNKRGAEAAVRKSLKDPESARFGDFYFNSKTKKACLAVNAKNSMGGYTGFKQAVLEKSDEHGWVSGGEVETDLEGCKRFWANEMNQ